MFDLIRSIQKRDYDATFFEVLFGYNGFHAVTWHRVSHAIWKIRLRALARFSSNLGRMLTGVEIHPAASIGKRLFIDHGTGCVIGATAIIGNDVTLYHGVTLGGVGKDGEIGKRHPTVEDGAMIGSGAQILGNITIGKNARVGSNSVVVKDIPAGCTAIGIPAKIICKNGESSGAYGMPKTSDWVI